MDRQRPDRNQPGRTHSFKVGTVTVFVTVNVDEGGNPRELFCKCSDGHQPEADGLGLLASLALQYGCPVEQVSDKLKYRRYEPSGLPGQPLSISDGIGKVLEEYVEKRG